LEEYGKVIGIVSSTNQVADPYVPPQAYQPSLSALMTDDEHRCMIEKKVKSLNALVVVLHYTLMTAFAGKT
jgi:hypothetical protein